MEAGTCCMRFKPTCRWTSSEEEKRQRFLSPMAHSAQRSTGPWSLILRIGAAIGPRPGNHERDLGGGGRVTLGLNWHRLSILTLVLLGSPSAGLPAEETRPVGEPAVHVFKAPGGVELKAYVFSPPLQKGSAPRPAIVIFHGGGWAMGEPAWAFSRARHFAERGMVGLAVQYRLSD